MHLTGSLTRLDGRSAASLSRSTSSPPPACSSLRNTLHARLVTRQETTSAGFPSRGGHDALRKALSTAAAGLVALSTFLGGAAPARAAEQLAAKSPEQQQQQPQPQLSPAAAAGLAVEDLPAIPTEFPPLADVKLPDIEQVALPNGLRLFLLEDHEVPLVQGTLLVRGGMRASPPDKVGVATLTAATQRAGGSRGHPADALNARLEALAASIEGGVLGEASVFSFSCLKETTPEVLGLFGEVVRQPLVPEEKVDLVKAQVLNYLQHINDDFGAVPQRQLGKLLYGRESVFARTPTAAQVSALSRADVMAHWAAWERPDNALLGMVGDFDAAAMKALVEETFGAWQPQPGQPKDPPQVPNSPLPQADKGVIYLVDRPGLSQAAIAMGEVGLSREDPDAAPLDVLGDVLNSFGGRLFNEIRSREGLAYSVSGGWDSSPTDHPGLFRAGGETSTAKAAEFVSRLQAALQGARESAPQPAELARSQTQALNSFVFNFASSAAQLQRLLTYALLGLPLDELYLYRQRLEAVTAEDVLAAAQRHLHPADQTVVVAGDAKQLRPLLASLGRPIRDLSVEG